LAGLTTPFGLTIPEVNIAAKAAGVKTQSGLASAGNPLLSPQLLIMHSVVKDKIIASDVFAIVVGRESMRIRF
jgi:hypothetical protein